MRNRPQQSLPGLRSSRRTFLGMSAAGAVAAGLQGRLAMAAESPPPPTGIDPYFTPAAKFQDVSRGTPIPHTLTEEQKGAVGLTRETWRLEVAADPDHPVKLRNPFRRDGSGEELFDFERLMRLAETRAVRFAKVMTCLNLGCPLGMGLWEGVPLRDVFWLTKPSEDVRRVHYYGFHNDDPKQMFRSSLPIGRILEDPFDLPPVVLCYKLNGEWLDSQRGGPVRLVVPEHYGFKSVKWLSHVVLTSLSHANDTYAEQGNDIDSPLKTFAATIDPPREVKAGEPVAVRGYAQAGISGLAKVQVWLSPAGEDWPADDRYFETAPWVDAEILGPPEDWGGGLPGGRIPAGTLGFDDSGRPKSWPMRLSKVDWTARLPAKAAGEYTLRCRTVDEQGHAQPLPRPFRKSGHSAIESVTIKVVG